MKRLHTQCESEEPATTGQVGPGAPAASAPDERPPVHCRGYLASMLVCVSILLSSTALFNYLVDPYLRFGSPRLEGFNARKPAAIKQVKMAKTYGVCQGEYKTILLGNSRVDVGLNPQSDAFPAQWHPVYNLGQPGTGSQASLLYLQHVLAHYRPSHVIAGVDFLSFLEASSEAQAGAATTQPPPEQLQVSPARTSEGSLLPTQQCIRDVLAADLSLSALADSIRTIAAQTNPFSADITERGFNTAQAFRAIIRAEGQAALFEQKNREYEAKLLRQRAPAFENSHEIKAIIELLDLCRAQHISVKLFIHPYHADVLDTIQKTGHWEEFKSWKSYLAAACERRRVELWDFSEYSPVTTEAVPQPDDHQTVMKGYWESGHYRDTTGDLVLARMFGSSAVYQFGTQLSRN